MSKGFSRRAGAENAEKASPPAEKKDKPHCKRPCKYRCTYDGTKCGYDFLGMTGRSRLKIIYDMLGVERLSGEQLRREPLLRPKNCPVFEPKPKGRTRKPQKAISLPGSRPKKKQPRTAHNKGKYSFDSISATRLYQQGLNDHQIADAVGTRTSNIAWWRKSNGLPANWKQGRNK